MIPIPEDLEANDLDLLSILLPEFFNAMTIGPRFRDMNWEEEFKKDMIIGKGFVVTQPPFKKRKKDKEGGGSTKGLKNMYGIHSPLFGSDWKDDNAFAERYSCECGETIGRVYEGKRCPKCNKKVKFVDVDLSFRSIYERSYMQISLIAGNSRNRQSAAKTKYSKVQRLIVRPSGRKWEISLLR